MKTQPLSLLALATFAVSVPTESHAPYLETFHRDGKTLIYLAALHHSAIQYPDASQDPVFKTIAHAFKTAPPDAVIVEGVDPSDLANFRAHADQCALSNFAKTYCGEPAYTAHLATERQADVYTGEPSALTLLSFFQSHGYSVEDYFGFIAMRQAAFAKTQPSVDFSQMLEALVRQQNRLLGTSVRFTERDFAQWYASHMTTPAQYMDLTTEDGSPYVSNGVPKTLFHSLSALSEEARDANIVETVKSALRTHKTVLIVYGASHLSFEWNDLVRMMGKPRKTKMY